MHAPRPSSLQRPVHARGPAPPQASAPVLTDQTTLTIQDEEVHTLLHTTHDVHRTFPPQAPPPVSIRQFLAGRTLLITGATGFLGKVLVEKILYEQPDVAHIYLLMQPRGSQHAHDRLVEQVVPSEAFARLQERHGDGYHDFMMSKLSAVEGRLGLPALGIDEQTLEHLHEVCGAGCLW